MNRTILAATLSATLGATLSLLFCDAVRAAAVDLDTGHAIGLHDIAVHDNADPAPVVHAAAPTPPSPSMSELPEPEVFAMMLVGLILIGYRASRDSSEKFK